MKILLAAYTTPATGDHGYRWIWKDPSIPDSILTNLYNSLSASLPDVSNFSLNDIAGGAIMLGKRHVAIYRFLNGGKDAIGREGRFFLICGIIDIADAGRLNLYDALTRPEFCTVRDIIPSSTCMESNSGSGVLTNLEIEQLKESNEFKLFGKESAGKAMSVFRAYQDFSMLNIMLSGSTASPVVVVKAKKIVVPEVSLKGKVSSPGVYNEVICKVKGYRERHLLIAFAVGFISGILLCGFVSLCKGYLSGGKKPPIPPREEEIKPEPTTVTKQEEDTQKEKVDELKEKSSGGDEKKQAEEKQ